MVLSGEGADEEFCGYLYFHSCPSVHELQKEIVRKVRGLHQFDCLRANKAMAAWGVEARVPFLDRDFVDFAMTKVAARDKLCGRAAGGRIEKWVLREAFKDYLPESIRTRQKEQFSDGVGYGWINAMKAHAEATVSDADFKEAATRFAHNTPITKEAYMIRALFDSHFPHADAAKTVPGGPSVACSTAAAMEWDASFKQFADCSGRSIKGVHTAAYDDQQRQTAK
jgi:asparagine synthase (glutamine-hydrolysing)